MAPAAKTVAEPAASAAAAPPASQAAAPAAAPTPAPSSSGGEKASASSIDVVVPDIGDFDEVAVIEVLVEVGDRVDVEQSLITVESDKASMEIPSSAAGTVESLAVKVGDKVAKGSRIAVVKGENSSDGKSSGASADADAQAEADRSPTRSKRCRRDAVVRAAAIACRDAGIGRVARYGGVGGGVAFGRAPAPHGGAACP